MLKRKTQKKKTCGCQALRLWGGRKSVRKCSTRKGGRKSRKNRRGGNCPFCQKKSGGDGGFVGVATYPFGGETAENTIPLNPNIGGTCDQTSPATIAEGRNVNI